MLSRQRQAPKSWRAKACRIGKSRASCVTASSPRRVGDGGGSSSSSMAVLRHRTTKGSDRRTQPRISSTSSNAAGSGPRWCSRGAGGGALTRSPKRTCIVTTNGSSSAAKTFVLVAPATSSRGESRCKLVFSSTVSLRCWSPTISSGTRSMGAWGSRRAARTTSCSSVHHSVVGPRTVLRTMRACTTRHFGDARNSRANPITKFRASTNVDVPKYPTSVDHCRREPLAMGGTRSSNAWANVWSATSPAQRTHPSFKASSTRSAVAHMPTTTTPTTAPTAPAETTENNATANAHTHRHAWGSTSN
mmetsp:Transcript_10419/g.31441  ORF Transcript_10419/g.31441 Transcript_10419/m.31441 type:complete len:304 (+) Transcript_10419:84-995(+)